MASAIILTKLPLEVVGPIDRAMLAKLVADFLPGLGVALKNAA